VKQVEFLLNSIQPFISLQRFLRLLKERGLGVEEVLEITVLIWLMSWTATSSIPVD
jgi:hypothetical protein